MAPRADADGIAWLEPERSQCLVDPADGLFLTQHFGNLEYRWSEFASYQHDTKRKLQFTRLDTCRFSELLEEVLQRGCIPAAHTRECGSVIFEEALAVIIPLGADGHRIEFPRRGKKEMAMVPEIGEQRATVLHELEHFLK